MKKILLSLFYMITIPALAMNNGKQPASSDDEGNVVQMSFAPAQSVAIKGFKTYGKIVNEKTLMQIIALKQIATQQGQFIALEIAKQYALTSCLDPRNFLRLHPFSNENILTETYFDARDAERLEQLNVLLEFIADPDYQFFQKTLIKFIYDNPKLSYHPSEIPMGYSSHVIHSDNEVTAAQFAERQQYPQEVVDSMHPYDPIARSQLLKKLINNPELVGAIAPETARACNQFGETILYNIMEYRDLTQDQRRYCIAKLIQAGADPLIRNRHGISCLLYAILTHGIDLAKCLTSDQNIIRLLEQGNIHELAPLLDDEKIDRAAALMTALYTGQREWGRYFLDSTINIKPVEQKIRRSWKMSLLALVFELQCYDLIPKLLERGISPNELYEDGNTALMILLSQSNSPRIQLYDFTELCIRYDADLTLRNNADHSALDLAHMNGYPEIAHRLEQALAQQ